MRSGSSRSPLSPKSKADRVIVDDLDLGHLAEIAAVEGLALVAQHLEREEHLLRGERLASEKVARGSRSKIAKERSSGMRMARATNP